MLLISYKTSFFFFFFFSLFFVFSFFRCLFVVWEDADVFLLEILIPWPQNARMVLHISAFFRHSAFIVFHSAEKRKNGRTGDFILILIPRKSGVCLLVQVILVTWKTLGSVCFEAWNLFTPEGRRPKRRSWFLDKSNPRVDSRGSRSETSRL